PRRTREAPALLLAQVAVAELSRLPPGVQAEQRLTDAVLVVGRDDDAGAGLADELRGHAVGRHRGQNGPLGGQVLEDLPARDDLAAARRVRQQEQVRLRVALQLERAAVRQVVHQLEPVAPVQLLHPLAVDRAEAADETRDAVVQARRGERGQERARVALAEEAAGMRDPEALPRAVLET